MKIRNIIISLLIVILLIAVGWAYWYFLMGPVQVPLGPEVQEPPVGFQPLGRPVTPGANRPGTATTTATTTPQQPGALVRIPTLRLLSDSPVGGYGASTTATTTKVLWVDRGRGNIYQATYDSAVIATLSNTVVPKIFRSVWNKNLTAFIASMFEDGNLYPTTVYTDIVPSKKASTTAQFSPYELRGRNISGNVIGYAASPDTSRVIVVVNENGTGAGYISSFNATAPTRIFTTPITDMSISWPADDVIAITTKPSANYGGFLYFVNPKNGAWTKIMGPIYGLTATVNRTGKYVLYSSSKDGAVVTGIYSVSAATTTDTVFRTLSDKCVWGNLYRELAYCGVPSELPSGTYPDDWYLGSVSTADKIWQMNATTGEAKLISSLIDKADRVLNVFNPGLDQKDKFLFFMNKNDLSLWSLDLVRP